MIRSIEPPRAMRALAGVLFVAAALSPGVSSGGPLPGFEPAAPSAGLLGSGLLDLSRLDVSHSLSYGMTSSSAGSQSGGLWLTQVGYQASRPLRLSMDLGMTIHPSQGWMNENSFFLHRLAMDYQPSRHFQLHVSYVNVPAQAGSVFGVAPNPGFGWGSRSWGDPAGPGR
jgi:hypothetical protein